MHEYLTIGHVLFVSLCQSLMIPYEFPSLTSHRLSQAWEPGLVTAAESPVPGTAGVGRIRSGPDAGLAGLGSPKGQDRHVMRHVVKLGLV